MIAVWVCGFVVFNFLPKFFTGQTVENVALFSTAHPVENFGRKYQKKGGENTHTRRWTVQFSTLFFLPVRLPLNTSCAKKRTGGHSQPSTNTNTNKN
jgi:hypothetical protein